MLSKTLQALSRRLQSSTARNLSSSSTVHNATNQQLVNLTVDDKTGIATLELNRPPVNTLNTSLLLAISAALTEVEKNRAKGMILTSSSSTVFSAGLDILEMYKPDPERARIFWTAMQDVWLKLYGSTYPTAAAINGHAPAGGCLLALSCEYRVMCPNASIGLNDTRLGMVATDWFQASMHNVISKREAEKALTLGTMFNADQAFKIGLIDEIATDEADAKKRCETFLLQFAKVPSNARSMTKQMLRSKDLAELENNRERDFQWVFEYVNSPIVQTNLKSFLDAIKMKESKSK